MHLDTNISTVDATKEFVSGMEQALLQLIGPNLNQALATAHASNFASYYNERWRDHHSITHPVRMDRELRRFDPSDPDFPFLLPQGRLKIFGHDTIIKLGSEPGWNERVSGELTRDCLLALGATEEDAEFVRFGINCTFTHHLPHRGRLPDERQRNTIALLIDLDLAGLGEPWPIFCQDTEANWQEWQVVSMREQFNAGRAAWAARFLKRKRDSPIYWTPYFADREDQARQNLTRLANSA